MNSPANEMNPGSSSCASGAPSSPVQAMDVSLTEDDVVDVIDAVVSTDGMFVSVSHLCLTSNEMSVSFCIVVIVDDLEDSDKVSVSVCLDDFKTPSE